MTEEISRRDFLDLALKGGVAIWGAAMLAPTIIYVWPASKSGGGGEAISAGAIKEFPVGSAKMIQAGGKPIMVIRTGEDSFKAFSAICTHLGCIVKWDSEDKKIKCPCHAAVFGSDGKVIAGPPPAPLKEFTVMVAGDEVKVKI